MIFIGDQTQLIPQLNIETLRAMFVRLTIIKLAAL